MHPNWARDTSAEIARRLHLGQSQLPPGTWRTDANDPFFMARMLDKVVSTTFKQVPVDPIRSMVQIDTIEEGLDTLSHLFYETAGLGSAKANHAKDMPLVDAAGAELQIKPGLNWLGCIYSLEELKKSARAGGPALDQVKMQAVADGLEKTYALQLRFGSPGKNTKGLFNFTGVDTFSLPTGDWLNAARTSQEIINDFAALIADVEIDSGNVHHVNRIAMGPIAWRKITTPIFGTDAGGKSILTVLKETYPQIQFMSYYAMDTSSGPTDVDRLGNVLGLNGIDQLMAWEDSPLVAPRSFMAREASPEAPQQELADFTVMWLQECYQGIYLPFPKAARYVTNHIA